jgi:hypothetical protein
MINNPAFGCWEFDDEENIEDELGVSKDGLPEQSILEKEAEAEDPVMISLRKLVLSMVKKKMEIAEESLGTYIEDYDLDLLDMANSRMLRNVVNEYRLGLITV